MLNNKAFICSIFMVLLCTLLYRNSTHAATYYAASNGSGGCSTNADAGSSLFTGIACLSVGDTLYLRQGTYNIAVQHGINVAIPSGTNFTTGAITIASYPNETATITQGIDVSGAALQYVIFDRLLLDSGATGDCDCETPSGFRAVNSDVHHIRLSNSEVRNANNNLIQFVVNPTAQSSFLELIGNNIHHSYDNHNNASGGTWAGYCMYIGARDSLIDGNTFHDCGGYAVHQYSAYSDNIFRNTYRNNIFYNSGRSDGTRGDLMGTVILSSGGDNLFYNNIIYGGTFPLHGSAILINGADNRIYNNTIYGNRGNGIYMYPSFPGSTNTIVRNNISYANDTNIQDDGIGTNRSNNLEGVNPQFVNVSTADFHLQTGSPAIGYGVNLSNVFTTDIAGLTRIASGAWDVGAYTFTALPPTAVQVEFTIQPGNKTVSQPINDVNVQLQNESGALVTSATDTVTVALVSTQINMANLTFVSADSFNTGFETSKAIDGDVNTFWFTRFTPDSPTHPHNIVVSFPSGSINGMTYLPRQDGGTDGYVSGYNVYVSTDGLNWGSPVKTGTFGTQVKRYGITWTPKAGSYLKFESTSSTPENVYASMAEMTVLQTSNVALNGTKVVQASGGNSLFSGLSIGTVAMRYILQATAPGLTSQLSTPFDITAPPPPPAISPPSVLRYIPGR